MQEEAACDSQGNERQCGTAWRGIAGLTNDCCAACAFTRTTVENAISAGRKRLCMSVVNKDQTREFSKRDSVAEWTRGWAAALGSIRILVSAHTKEVLFGTQKKSGDKRSNRDFLGEREDLYYKKSTNQDERVSLLDHGGGSAPLKSATFVDSDDSEADNRFGSAGGLAEISKLLSASPLKQVRRQETSSQVEEEVLEQVLNAQLSGLQQLDSMLEREERAQLDQQFDDQPFDGQQLGDQHRTQRHREQRHSDVWVDPTLSLPPSTCRKSPRSANSIDSLMDGDEDQFVSDATKWLPSFFSPGGYDL